MKKYLLVTLILVVTSSSLVTAQQQKPALQSSTDRKIAETPTQLLLEIYYNSKLPPAYSTVNGPEVKAKWIWVTRFGRVSDIKAAGPPIGAVKLESQFNGETADVRVTLLRGEKGFDQEDLVSIYHIGLGEQRTLKELRAYGVEPFRIKLLNPLPPLPSPPSFENRTKTIDVASVRSENIPRPAYVITFRNGSDKQLLALRLDSLRDGKPGVTTTFRTEDGKPIIEPGGTGERWFPVMITQANNTGGYEPGTALTNTIIIRTAVFADLTFEGDVQPACEVEAMLRGERVWLKHVLPLLDEELQRPINDHIEAARQFKEKFSALGYEFSESERNRVSSVSSQCKNQMEIAEVAPKIMKLEVLHDLDEIITKRPAPPVNFKAWLEARQAYYKAWFARLSLVATPPM
jgi:hypothetical protein